MASSQPRSPTPRAGRIVAPAPNLASERRRRLRQSRRVTASPRPFEFLALTVQAPRSTLLLCRSLRRRLRPETWHARHPRHGGGVGGKGEPAVSLAGHMVSRWLWSVMSSLALPVVPAPQLSGSSPRGKLPVRAVSRGDIVDLPDDVEHVAADVGTIEGARRACHGAAVVYHCVQPDYTKWAELFPPFFAHRVCRSGRSPERRTRRSWTPRRALVIVAGIVERIACASRDRTEPQRLTTAPNDRSMRDRGRSERHLSTGRRCQAGRWRSDSAADAGSV